MFGLRNEGLILPRYADFLEMSIASYEAETGVKINREPGDVLFSLFVVLARQDDAQMQMMQAVYDAQDPNNATGVQLDLLASIGGVARFRAAASVATLAITGTPGVVVPDGKRVADANGIWWQLTNATAFDSNGDGVTDATAEVFGATTTPTGVNVEIINPVAGWDTAQFVTITPGRLQETDAELRRRRVQAMQIRGTASVKAIRARLLALPSIRAAVVLENDTPNTQTIAGIPNVPPHSVIPVLFTDRGDGRFDPGADAVDVARVARVLYEHVAAGVQCYGTEQTGTITGADGGTKTIAWNYTSDVPVVVAVVVVGVSASIVEEAIQQRITAHVESLHVGEALRRLSLIIAIGAIPGVSGLDITLNGAASDVVVTATQIAVLSGAVVVTN